MGASIDAPMFFICTVSLLVEATRKQGELQLSNLV